MLIALLLIRLRRTLPNNWYRKHSVVCNVWIGVIRPIGLCLHCQLWIFLTGAWRRWIRWIITICCVLALIWTTRTRLNAFTPSCLFNATAVQYRTSINQHKLTLSHSPGGGTTLQTPFSRYRLVKVSWKSVQPFPRTVVSYFFADGKNKKNKKQKTKKICETYTLPPYRRLRKKCENKLLRSFVHCDVNHCFCTVG